MRLFLLKGTMSRMVRHRFLLYCTIVRAEIETLEFE
jgi:hypothetical protein